MLNDTTALRNFIAANYWDENGYGLVANPEHWAEYGITTIPQLQMYLLKNEIWDLYKSAHGIRPRWMGLWSDDWSWASLEKLYADTVESAERAFDEAAARQREAVVSFENHLAEVMSLGAGDRQTAFRWLTSEYEGQCASQGYIEWDFDVPYGTFAEFFSQEAAA